MVQNIIKHVDIEPEPLEFGRGGGGDSSEYMHTVMMFNNTMMMFPPFFFCAACTPVHDAESECTSHQDTWH